MLASSSHMGGNRVPVDRLRLCRDGKISRKASIPKRSQTARVVEPSRRCRQQCVIPTAASFDKLHASITRCSNQSTGPGPACPHQVPHYPSCSRRPKGPTPLMLCELSAISHSGLARSAAPAQRRGGQAAWMHWRPAMVAVSALVCAIRAWCPAGRPGRQPTSERAPSAPAPTVRTSLRCGFRAAVSGPCRRSSPCRSAASPARPPARHSSAPPPIPSDD